MERLDRLIEEASLDSQIATSTGRWSEGNNSMSRILARTKQILLADEDVTMEEFDAWIFQIKTHRRYLFRSFKASKPGPLQLKIGGMKPVDDHPKYTFFAEKEILQVLRGTKIEIKKVFLAALNGVGIDEDIRVESSHNA